MGYFPHKIDVLRTNLYLFTSRHIGVTPNRIFWKITWTRKVFVESNTNVPPCMNLKDHHNSYSNFDRIIAEASKGSNYQINTTSNVHHMDSHFYKVKDTNAKLQSLFAKLGIKYSINLFTLNNFHCKRMCFKEWSVQKVYWL